VTSIMEVRDVQPFAELVPQIFPNEAVAGQAITKNRRWPLRLVFLT